MDTGSALSILPPGLAKATRPNHQPLIAANGTPIKSFGTRQIELQLGLQKYSWRFIIAEVTQPIIGGDFLRSHSLLVDLANERLIRTDNLKIIKGSRSLHSSFQIASLVSSDKFMSLLRKRPALTTPTFSCSLPKHGVQHRIPTTGFPVHSQARRLSPEKFKVSKEEYDTLVKLGIARRSNSPYSSPLHVVPKPNGEWRPCGDYRRLNESTEFDRYPIPRIHDFTSNLAGKCIFSKVDLIKGYHQIPVHPDDVPKTAVITPFGLFEFLRMPMGLKNAAQAFQRLMDSVCAGLEFVFVYLDDILIASESEDQHVKHLTMLFDRLEENGLVVKTEKCLLGVSEIDFLGHRVSKDGILPLPAKVRAISSFPAPTTVTSLEKFVGMVNFYHVFVPKAAEVMKPLYKALSTKPRPKELDWTSELDHAFQEAKRLLADATLLHHPVPGARTVLTTDASDIAIGAVLEQRVEEHWQPLAFFSRQLNKAERNYSTIDRELLGIHSAILHFRYFLEGRDFTVYTDHKPIVAAIKKKSELKSGRQSRHLATISEFTTDIQHVTGKDNVVADALSRVIVHPVSQQSVATCRGQEDVDSEFQPTNCLVPGFRFGHVNAIKPGLDYRAMATDQQSDQDVQNYRTAISNLRLEDVPFESGTFTLLCDVSTGVARPIVPETWRKRVFDTFHSLSHPGARTTKKLVSSKFVWHGLGREITIWARCCVPCQRAKIHRHTKAPLSKFEPTSRRFEHVHIDLVGPLPESQGCSYLLTAVDRFTRWLEAVPIQKIDTYTIARAYIQNWVARFGVPLHMTSDRGPQFVSELWSCMSNLLGTDLHPTTAYHPQANGLIERNHRDLKASLKCRLSGPNWVDELPWVLLGLRTAPKEDLHSSSAELVYGSPLTVPGDFFPDSKPRSAPRELQQQRERVGKLCPVPTTAHGEDKIQAHVPNSLKQAKFVFVRHDARRTPLQTPYDGPFEVIERTPKHFTLQLGDKRDKISIDRLKPAYLDQSQPPQVAQPPRRGRPPKQRVAVPEVPEVPEVQQPEVNIGQQAVQNRRPTSCPDVPVKPSYAEVVTSRGRISRPTQRYLEVSACLGGGM